MAVEAKFSGGEGEGPGVVGVDSSERHNAVALSLNSICQYELRLADLQSGTRGS